MNATEVMNAHRAKLAATFRPVAKAKWRKIETAPLRKNGVRRHTAALRDVRYDD